MSQSYFYPPTSNVDPLTPQHVIVDSSALPTGASTEAKQDVGNASVASIDNKTPALGQALMAASVPVVVASDQTPIPTASSPISATISGSTTAVGSVIPSTDVSSYAYVSIYTTSIGSATVQAQFSNDNTNWYAVSLADPSSATYSATVGTGIRIAPVSGKYFRLQCISYSSGTQAAIVQLSSAGGCDFTSYVSASQIGSWIVSSRTQDGTGTSIGSGYGSASGALRVAAQIGNASAVADFNSGATSAQTLRTVSASDSPDVAAVTAFSDKTASAMVSEPFDYQEIAYVGATTDIDTVVFKSGGSGGTTVATLTMGYDGSNRLTSVTRS